MKTLYDVHEEQGEDDLELAYIYVCDYVCACFVCVMAPW
jgi:hypothetical protein